MRGPLADSGPWADAARERRPQVHEPGAGEPAGQRAIVVPIVEDGRVRMLAGVLGRSTPYRDVDTETVQLLAHELWRILRRRRSEAVSRKLSMAVEQSPESVVITDVDARIEYVNEAFIRNTGYSREEVMGRNPRFLSSGRTPRAVFEALWAALRAGREWKGEFSNRRRDGTEFCELATVAPIRQPDGEITHYVAVKADITDRKRDEAELARHRDHLEELVSERTARLAASEERAASLARAKSEFLAQMSHEIRTPLNAVIGFAQVGRRESQGRRSLDTFNHILDAGNSLLDVLNDVLDFSKIEAGRLELESTTVMLWEVTERAASVVRTLAGEKGLEFRVEKSPDLPLTCQGDRLRLFQVLSNLLTNAVKFTERGSVLLSAGTSGDELVFSVRDTGIGIAEEDVERLFEPFEQGDRTISRRYGGTGLGLSICRRLVSMMGGRIGVDSVVGLGTTFVVRLPLREPEGVAAHGAPPGAAPWTTPTQRLRGLRLLAAEDSVWNRMVLEHLLTGEGAELVHVGRGEDAVAAASAGTFDLALLDIQMPGIGGFETARRIRSIVPTLPTLGLTADARPEDREQARAAGMHDLLMKPIDLDRLVAAVLRLLPDPARTPPAGPPARWPSRKGLPIVRMFRTQHANDPATLRAAAVEARLGDCLGITHTLMGLADGLIPSELRALARAVDEAIRREDTDAAAQVLVLAGALDEQLGRMAASEIEVAESSPSGPAQADAPWEAIDRLEGLLVLADTAVDELLGERGTWALVIGEDRTSELVDRIAVFDYPGALEIVRQARAGV